MAFMFNTLEDEKQRKGERRKGEGNRKDNKGEGKH
jgi:hypothetical protein